MRQHAGIAQWIEHLIPNQEVVGSSPTSRASFFVDFLVSFYMLIGMARACKTMMELRERMAFQYGRKPMQLTIFMPPFLNDSRTD